MVPVLSLAMRVGRGGRCDGGRHKVVRVLRFHSNSIVDSIPTIRGQDILNQVALNKVR